MCNQNKVNAKRKFGFCFTLLLLILTFPVLQASAQVLPKDKIGVEAGSLSDTTHPVVNSFDLKISKDSLQAPMFYKAEDSLIVDVPEKRMYLYGRESNIKYIDNDLTAPYINFDSKTSMVTAALSLDSAGRPETFPVFKQGDFTSQMDTILFNIKTGKGLTKGTYTKQGEMYVYGKTIKKVDEKTIFAQDTRFTTCDLDTPHFAFKARKVKFVSKEWAYSGPIHPEFEGVPVPVVLPFGIFPLKTGVHSGLLSPSVGSNNQWGLSLENLGYYKYFNDNIDLIVYGSIYSYGGYAGRINPRYFKRYKYSGNMELSYQSYKLLDSSRTNTFAINWSHQADMKARPGQTFSANVNIRSTRYNEMVPNSPLQNVSNQAGSSIAYSKNWKSRPFSFTVSSNHTQNAVSKYFDVSIPTVVFNMSTIYPLRSKNPVGAYKWYENLGVGLSTRTTNRTYFYDTTGGKPISEQFLDNYKYGVQHSVPIILALPSLGPLNITPSISYAENWYQQKLVRKWNPDKNAVDTLSLEKGFYTARNMSFGIGVATRIFGMFGFKKTSRVLGIRHQLSPSISLNYTPDLNRRSQYYLQTDSSSRRVLENYFNGNVIGAPSMGEFGGISFGIDNNLAMKVRNKQDTALSKAKKIGLIDALSLRSQYNFLKDSFRMGNINLNGSSNLFNKLRITATGTFSPYDSDSSGYMIDRFVWRRTPLSLGKLLGGSISLSTSFRGGEKKNQTPENAMVTTQYDANGYPLNDYQKEAMYMSNNPGLYSDFTIPWDVNLSYSLTLNRTVYRQSTFTRLGSTVSQNVNFNGSINISPKWKVGGTAFYNITTAELGTASLYLSRDMHCWQLAVNIAPAGRYRFFNITLQPKSPILRDLKINRTRSFFE